MKYFGEFRNEQRFLAEGKVSMAKLKAGMKVNVIHSGRSAKNYGIKDQNVYGGKVQVLGIGVKPYKDKPNARMVLAKDMKDLKKKYEKVFKSEEIQYGHFFGALDRLTAAFDMIGANDKRVKPGGGVWLWKVLEGENKGLVDFCFISQEPKWEVNFLNKSTEFILEA